MNYYSLVYLVILYHDSTLNSGLYSENPVFIELRLKTEYISIINDSWRRPVYCIIGYYADISINIDLLLIFINYYNGLYIFLDMHWS